MDGFAVRSRPGVNRPGRAPSDLRVIGRSFPGDAPRRLPRVGPGTAVEILTGAAMPPGADSVMRLEDCRRTGHWVHPRKLAIAGRDVARRGDDFRPGQVIVAKGASLRPWHIAALLANEITTVGVVRRLRVGVVSIGDELVAEGVPWRPGRVRDTTRPLLLAVLADLGVPSVDLGRVPDREVAVRRVVRRGLRVCDVLVTTGGSSVGSRDIVPRAIEKVGPTRWLATRVRMRPGSTTRVAWVGKRPVFLLSGPPVAAFSGFVNVVEPFLRHHGAGAGSVGPNVTALLDRSIAHSRGVRELVRVRIRRRGGARRAVLLERHGAARLSSLTGADGLLILDEQRGNYRKGEVVHLVLL